MEFGWVLKLKDEYREGWMNNESYYLNDSEEDDFLTNDLQQATVIKDKQDQIEEMTAYEAEMKKRYGEDCICNFGITNITKNFDFVEVELIDVDKEYCIACEAEIDTKKDKVFHDVEGGQWCQACGDLELSKKEV